MGKAPGDIRAEIEETRARVGEEIDALSYKTDVGARVDDFVEEKKDALRSGVGRIASKVTSAGGKAVPDRQQLAKVKGAAEGSPVGMLAGGFAVGLVTGLLLPATRVERQRIGSVSEKVVDAARETGKEAIERGRHVADEAIHAAVDTAKETGREEGQQLASTLKERTGGEEQSQQPPARPAPPAGI